jgi:predicted amino acid racemase
VIPTRDKMLELLEVKKNLEDATGIQLRRVSGGNSANMLLVLGGKMPSGINNLRIGESILLGTEAVKRQPVEGCVTDTFTLMAEVIELLDKPSKPLGTIGQNAFGVVPTFVDKGVRRRAICAIGRQDVDASGLYPLMDGVSVLGASSDHLILDVEEATQAVDVGSVISFRPNYSALLQASTSPFVEKVVK